MDANKLFLKRLSESQARFHLCDLHVHTPASFDLRGGERYEHLSDREKELVGLIEEGLTPAEHEQAALEHFSPDAYYDLLAARRSAVTANLGMAFQEDWALVGVTDHNVCEYACALAAHAWQPPMRQENRLVVLPGIELTVEFQVEDEGSTSAHVLCLFAPTTTSSDIRIAIREASGCEWRFGEDLSVGNLAQFVNGLRHHGSYPGLCIAAHVGTSRGIREEAKNCILDKLDAAVLRLEGELAGGEEQDNDELASKLEELKGQREDPERVSTAVLRLLGECGFDALQVRGKKDEPHYRRLHRYKEQLGRAVPIVCSDAHRIDDVFRVDDEHGGEVHPCIKLPSGQRGVEPEAFFHMVREKAIRYGETRFSFVVPGSVTNWIAGIEMSPDSSNAVRFWPFTADEDGDAASDAAHAETFVVPLSRNLNCLIGGRGAGKSAFIEALSFLIKSDGYAKRGEMDRDWYARAKATLSGCNMRLCWQTTGQKAPGEVLPGGTLFVQRYFDASDKHRDPKYSAKDGSELLPSDVPDLPVEIFRLHDIEDAVKPKKLRGILDGICGNDIKDLGAGVSDVQRQLRDLREELCGIAEQIAELTEDGAPLREYARRRQQYVEVNRKDIREQYEVVDQADSAAKTAARAESRWLDLLEELDPDSWTKKVKAFQVSLRKDVLDKAGKPKPFHDPLAVVLSHGQREAKKGPAPLDKALAAISATRESLDGLTELLSKAVKATGTAHRKAGDALVKQGLPIGAEDRQAKKAAHEEAELALEEYRTLMLQWDAKMSERDVLFKNLQEKCKARTELRKRTAEEITSRLSRDLDKNVLVIQADAQPMADKHAFVKWLNNGIDWSSLRYRDARISALLDTGLQPGALRDVLLARGEMGKSILVTKKAKTSEGKISSREAEDIIRGLRGAYRTDPELQEDLVEANLWQELPSEIKDGLWVFPRTTADADDLKVDTVLELDEIVFDDIPIIRSNDRPQETAVMKPLEKLSPGQRCSAMLPILLLNGTSPLIIDQPEDNLDNRLVRQVIVNVLASIKLRRQVIVATHNPNLPVLGDAERVVVLRAAEEHRCAVDALGSLDDHSVVSCITDVMEGGREAFQYRQTIYQAHWQGGISE